VRQQVEDLCLASGGLVADRSDCHSFYHCDELMPQKQSCGDLMFNNLRQNCDWPRSVMQIRPECRDPSRFTFRQGPRSWDSRRTRRMLTWLGNGRAVARVRRPQPRVPAAPRHIAPLPVFRPNSVQVVDQQRRRVLMPQRLSVPEAPRPHVVKLEVAQPVVQRFEDIPNSIAPQAHVVKAHVVPVAPEAPRPHVVKLDVARPVVRAPPTYQTVVRTAPVIQSPQVVRTAPVVRTRVVQSPLVRSHVLQAPVVSEHPTAEDLTFLISNRISQSIRERIPTILSQLRHQPIAKQTKVVQESVEEPKARVTHTVTSSSSSTSSKSGHLKPSHHYVQNSVIGEKDKRKKELKMMEDVKQMERETDYQVEGEDDEVDMMVNEAAQELKEDTREHKPVWTVDGEDAGRWTVTRERPRHITTEPSVDTTTTQPTEMEVKKVVKKVCWIGGARQGLTCKQVRRKLGQSSKGGRRRMLRPKGERTTTRQEEKSRMLFHQAQAMKEEPRVSLDLDNSIGNSVALSQEERRAVTLKEAFDRSIGRVAEEAAAEEERQPASRLRHLSEEYSGTLSRLLEVMVGEEEEYAKEAEYSRRYMTAFDTGREYVDSSNIRGQ